jgi:UDP:flavonoid glycosyltransferase YjiC (YdhE family)
MATIAFVTWAGGGNVPPALATAARARDAGHRSLVIGPPSLGERVSAEGLEFVPRLVSDEWDVELMATSVRELLDLHGVDVAVVDYMLPGALCGAEATGQPVAALVHTLYAALWRDGAPSPMAFATTLDAVNRARASVGLDPLDHLGQLLQRVDRVLVTCPAEVDLVLPDLAESVRYVGAVMPAADTMWSERRHPDLPLVVVSLGTTPMGEERVVQRVLDALADEPVEVLALLGDHLRPELVRAPANAQVRGYVRHASVFPMADVVVTHGGLGTVLAALRFGVPMLCVPLGREQPENAAAVERLGAGLVLDPEASEAALRDAVRELVGSDAHRLAATQVSRCFHTDDERWPIEDELDELVALAARRSAR